MTEAEAKEKWCPFARVAVGSINSTAAVNRPRKAGGGSCACIASECMAWRWHGERITLSEGPERPEGDGWTPWPFSHRWQRPDPEAKGYCGLAGTPKPGTD